MKIVRRSSINLISELPENIIENILTFLPLRDAARTSILSRKWRYQWANLPELVFDDSFIPTSKEDSRDIVMKINRMLSLHQGSISKFTLDITGLKSCSEIDNVILHLSRNGIQDFTLCLAREEDYELPDYFYSCLKLRHLFLSSCVFEPPPTFKGFSMLMSLELWVVDFPPNVCISNFPLLESLTLQTYVIIDSLSIDAPHLKSFWFIGFVNCVSFINTPLLAHLSFATDPLPEPGELTLDLINVLCCLPHIERLHLDSPYLTLLAVYNVPKILPAPLSYLRFLELTALSFTAMDELPCALCLMRSSPNLQKLRIQVSQGSHNEMEPFLEYLGIQDYSDIFLGKLREVEMDGDLNGLRPELEFIQFLLAKSPALEKMYLERSTRNIDMDLVKMLVEFTRFQRASPKAEILFPRLDLDQA